MDGWITLTTNRPDTTERTLWTNKINVAVAFVSEINNSGRNWWHASVLYLDLWFAVAVTNCRNPMAPRRWRETRRPAKEVRPPPETPGECNERTELHVPGETFLLKVFSPSPFAECSLSVWFRVRNQIRAHILRLIFAHTRAQLTTNVWRTNVRASKCNFSSISMMRHMYACVYLKIIVQVYWPRSSTANGTCVAYCMRITNAMCICVCISQVLLHSFWFCGCVLTHVLLSSS